MERSLDNKRSSASSSLPRDAIVTACSSSGLRGWRATMEDAVVHELLSGDAGLFAVLDGHGGRFCANWAARELPTRLAHLAACANCETSDEEAWQIAQQLSEAVRQMDADLRTAGQRAWACGSTLAALLVTRRSLTVANVGDSRAVLCRAGAALPLSRDHKPKVAAERQRILAAGGFIVDGRVNGDLSLSRALGDFRHKSLGHLPPSKQPVSSEPEVRSTKRTGDEHFVLLACDGLWDVISSNDATAFVNNRLERVASPLTQPLEMESARLALAVVCEDLCSEAVARGSTDNVSVIIVVLDPTLRAKQSLLQPEVLETERGEPSKAGAEASGNGNGSSKIETHGWLAGQPPPHAALAALTQAIPQALDASASAAGGTFWNGNLSRTTGMPPAVAVSSAKTSNEAAAAFQGVMTAPYPRPPQQQAAQFVPSSISSHNSKPSSSWSAGRGVRRVLLLMAFLLTACVTLFGMQFVSPATIMTATIAPIHDLTALSSGGFRARANCSLAEADHPGCAGYHRRRRRKADANAGLRVGL